MRLLALGVVILACCSVACPVQARGSAARRFLPPRTIAVVRDGWPIGRPARSVIVHPARTEVRVVCTGYAGSVGFGGEPVAAEAAPTRDLIAWEDGETLDRAEDWTEFTLHCGAAGQRIWLEVPAGRPQLDWAEVVFQDGHAQVVDLGERTLVPGLYALLDLPADRAPDHIRMVARSRTNESKILLRIQKP